MPASNTRKRTAAATRVNLGGPAYTDSQGRLWEGDRAYQAGSWGCLDMSRTDVLTTRDEIAGTEDAPLFQTIRTGEEIRYRFDVPNGRYRVRLLFAEVYWETNDAERQDVYLQGRKVLKNFSPFDEAGHDAAVEKEFTTQVTEEHLLLRFTGLSMPMHCGAHACALEVEPIRRARTTRSSRQ
jgi:beta-galactosidase